MRANYLTTWGIGGTCSTAYRFNYAYLAIVFPAFAWWSRGPTKLNLKFKP